MSKRVSAVRPPPEKRPKNKLLASLRARTSSASALT